MKIKIDLMVLCVWIHENWRVKGYQVPYKMTILQKIDCGIWLDKGDMRSFDILPSAWEIV